MSDVDVQLELLTPFVRYFAAVLASLLLVVPAQRSSCFAIDPTPRMVENSNTFSMLTNRIYQKTVIEQNAAEDAANWTTVLLRNVISVMRGYWSHVENATFRICLIWVARINCRKFTKPFPELGPVDGNQNRPLTPTQLSSAR
jgi:hypothetical protein